MSQIRIVMSLEKEYESFNEHQHKDKSEKSQSNYLGQNLHNLCHDMNAYEALKNDLTGINGKEKDYDKWLNKNLLYWAPVLSAIMPGFLIYYHSNEINNVPAILSLLLSFVMTMMLCSIVGSISFWKILPVGFRWRKKKNTLEQSMIDYKEKIIAKYNNKESFYEAFWFVDNVLNLAREKYGEEFAEYLKNNQGDEFWKELRSDVEYVFSNLGVKDNKNVKETLWIALLKLNNREQWLENTFKEYRAEKIQQKTAQENAVNMNEGYEKYLRHQGKELPARNLCEDPALNAIEQSIPDLKRIL